MRIIQDEAHNMGGIEKEKENEHKNDMHSSTRAICCNK